MRDKIIKWIDVYGVYFFAIYIFLVFIFATI